MPILRALDKAPDKTRRNGYWYYIDQSTSIWKKSNIYAQKRKKRGLKRLPPNERKERKTYTKISMRSTTSAMVLILRVLLSRLDEFPLTFLSVHLSIDRWKTENKAWNVREALYIPFWQSSTLVDRCRDFRTVRHAFQNRKKEKEEKTKNKTLLPTTLRFPWNH